MPPPSVRLLLLLLLLSRADASGQLANLKFAAYTTENGMADNYVVKTVTDKKGFLWIATRNGLSRFDGLRFTNYTAENSGLRSNWITDLAVDSQGTLWASTEWGLCHFDESANRFYYLNKKTDLVILYRAPLYLSGETLWTATESGLKKVNTVAKIIRPTSLQNIPDPQCMATDDAGNIWIGTRGHGLFVYDTAADTWTHRFLSTVSRDAHLMGFYKDKNHLWLATSEGLLRVANATETVLFSRSGAGLKPTAVDALTFVVSFPPLTADSLLICGTYNKRMAVFNKNTGLFTAVFSGDAARLYGLPNSIFNGAESGPTILWIATDKGLVSLNTQRQDYTTYLLNGTPWEKALIKKVTTAPAGEERLWLLTANPGTVVEYNTATNKIERTWPAAQEGTAYKTMLTDGKDRYWLVSDKGIDLFSPQGGIVPLYRLTNETVFSAAYAGDNALWLGTGNGLVKYNAATNTAAAYACGFRGTEVENNSHPSPFFASGVLPDGREAVWVTSGKYGLFRFCEATKTFTPYRQPSTTAYETKNRCSGLLFDKNGKLWMGNMAGLTAFDTARKTFTNYGHQAGLRSTYVYSIGWSEEGIIGRGNSGVFWRDAAGKKFANYPTPLPMSNGILEQRVSFAGKKAVVGFEGGFTVYNLVKATASAALPVYLTNVQVGGQPYPLPPPSVQTPSAFTYQQNDLQLEFACVDYDRPEAITYRYQLSGANEEWINAGTQRSVLLTNLAAGSYVFKVVAVDADGRQSRRPAEFRFVIRPPFWKTWWFRAAFGLAVTGLVWAGLYGRIKQIKKSEAQKTAVNKLIAEQEMKALRSQMNPHFIFNSLNSIQKYIWEAQQEDAAEYLTKFARLIRAILENSAQKLVPLQNEIASLKLYLELEHRRSNQKFDYEFSVDESLDVTKVLMPPLLLQPYIENAIWHGLNPKQSRGLLTVSLQRCNENLLCVVDDDGIGRTASFGHKKESHTSMGLNISHQRIFLMQQESGIKAGVNIVDKTGAEGNAAGTKIIIHLPLLFTHA